MKQQANYTKLKTELDKILDQLQASDGDIDTAVANYERGMRALKELEAYLKLADNKIQKIKKDFTQPSQ